MWLVKQEAILTKDIVLRKKWKGDKHCAFCNELESINHLFSLAKSVNMFGALWHYLLGLTVDPNQESNIGSGSLITYPKERSSIVLA